MNRNYYFIFLIVFYPLIFFSQSKKQQLEREFNKLQKEIKVIENDLNSRKKQKSLSLKEVGILTKKIDTRKKLIENNTFLLNEINGELLLKNKDIENNNRDIAKLKADYSKMIIWIYKNQENNHINKLAFLLESNSFKEAWTKMKYIKKYSNFRAQQSDILRNKINKILFRINTLQDTKNEKQNIVTKNIINNKKLIEEKNKRDFMMIQLDGEIKKLGEKVQNKNKQALQFKEKIKNIINEEIRKQRLKELEKLKKAKTTNPNVTLDIDKTPDGILSNSFLSSKGSLPWPVANGVIVSRFGKQPHPLAPELFIENNGIDIKSTTGSTVNSIYDGVVVRIFDLATFKTCIMVKHGEFFTVYSHLNAALVSVGQQVKARQLLGKVAKNDDLGYSFVNLQIWHYQNKVNPELWLK